MRRRPSSTAVRQRHATYKFNNRPIIFIEVGAYYMTNNGP